jgi:uncharacterized membrane protein
MSEGRAPDGPQQLGTRRAGLMVVDTNVEQNIRTIADLERRALAEKGWDERLSEGISDFVGSLTFVAVHVGWFTGWALWNGLAPEALRFDPYPYGLLTFVVSLEGVLVATFVLITQNRMNRQAEQRAHLNLQVDLLAEQEMTHVLRLLRQIGQRLNIEPESTHQQAEQLMSDTNAYDLMEGVKRAIQSGEGRDPQEPRR